MPQGSQNPDPISDQKMSFFTPIFRPVLQEIMSSLLRLEHQQKVFYLKSGADGLLLKFDFAFAYFSFFLIIILELKGSIRSYISVVP